MEQQAHDHYEPASAAADVEDTQRDKFLTFTLAGETYGIEVRYVREIVGLQKITEVPDMPDFVRGVINLRGQVIPVMDVRTRFRMPEREYNDRTCVVVVRLERSAIGLIVDTVDDVATIPAPSIAPPPSISRGESSRYILGIGRVGDDVRILLDVEKLLHEGELEALPENG